MLRISFRNAFDYKIADRDTRNDQKPVKNSIRNKFGISGSKFAALSIGLAALTGIESASAASLWWNKTPVHASSLKTCYAIAHEAMQGFNYQGIRVSRDEVAGTSLGVYAAVTCIGTNSPMAIVMVVGDDQNATKDASDTLSKRIGGTIHP